MSKERPPLCAFKDFLPVSVVWAHDKYLKEFPLPHLEHEEDDVTANIAVHRNEVQVHREDLRPELVQVQRLHLRL